MREQGGELIRTKVGDRYVVEAMREHGAVLGGEQSGHLVFMEYGTTGDGLLAALQLLRIMRERDKPVSALADQLHLYPQKLTNIKVPARVPFEEKPEIVEALQGAESKLGTRGRVLLRYSGTEPLIRLMVEAEDETLVDTLSVELAAVIKRVLS